MREGETIWNRSGVLTGLEESDVAHVMRVAQLECCEAIWRLYDMKMAVETYYSGSAQRPGLASPPSCNEIVRNTGFSAVATLAHTLASGVDFIGGQSAEGGSGARQDGGRRKRPRPRPAQSVFSLHPSQNARGPIETREFQAKTRAGDRNPPERSLAATRALRA